MKKFNTLVLLTAAVAASYSCNKAEIIEPKPASGNDLTLNVSTDELSTKTVFGALQDDNKYPTLWTEQDQVMFILNQTISVKPVAKPVGGVQLLISVCVSQAKHKAHSQSEPFLLPVL